MMTVCEEMKKLRQMLDEKNIPWHHYKQGKADAIAEKEGKLMQTFSPD